MIPDMIHRTCYVGPHGDRGQWGQRCRSYLHTVKHLSSLGLNIEADILPFFGAYEERLQLHPDYVSDYSETKTYDSVIQCVSPELFCQIGEAKNFILCDFATKGNNIYNSTLSLSDGIFVHSQIEKDIAHPSLQDKCQVIRPALFNSLSRVSPKKDINNSFIFYSPLLRDSENNLEALVMAYYSAFNVNDPVILGLPSTDHQEYSGFLTALKSLSGIYQDEQRYPEVRLYSDVGVLHSEGHCCIDASSSYCLSLACLDALGFGSPLLVPNNTAYSEVFEGHDVCYTFEVSEDFATQANRNNYQKYTAHEVFNLPNKISLSNIMQKIASDKLQYMYKRNNVTKLVSDEVFSSQEQAKEIGAILCS